MTSHPVTPLGTEDSREAPTLGDVVSVRSIVLTGIFTLMVIYTLYVAAPLFKPLMIAFLFSLMCAPVIRKLSQYKIPAPISAIVILLGLSAIIIGTVYGLSGPVSKWVEKAPQELRSVDEQLYSLIAPLEEKVESAKQVLKQVLPGEEKKATSSGPAATRWDPIAWLLSSTWSIAYGMGMSFILLYFMLASGDSFLRKLVRVLPRFEDKRMAVETIQHIQRSIAVFLGTITIINICLGLLAAAILFLLGMPNPVLFGLMVGLLNFAPYIGPLISFAILLLVALISFHDISRVLLVPGAVLLLNMLEGQFVTPTLAGRRLDLSPVVVFLSITFWGWMWGIAGILIAVPMMASVKLACERIEGLRPIAVFLGN